MFRSLRESQQVGRLAASLRRNPNDAPQRAEWDMLVEAIRDHSVDFGQLSIRNAFTSLVEDGHELLRDFGPQTAGNRSVLLREAGVDTSAFANISGQIVYSEVMAAYNLPVFIGPRLARNVPTEFDGEKIPGITGLGDAAESVGEGQPYPAIGVSETWVETPPTIKRGFVVPVTKEALFFDRTAQLLDRCRQTAQSVAINKEKRILDAVLGVTTLYRRNGAAAIATYSDAGGGFDNLAASNALTDYTDIDAARVLFEAITDPDTGEPIVVNPNQILLPSSLLATAANILNATEVRRHTASAAFTTISASPLLYQNLEVLSNQWVTARLAAASVATTTWFIGDFQAAFAYMENWPITTSEAPPNSEMEFTHDIVARFKVSERGAVACRDPRYAIKSTA